MLETEEYYGGTYPEPPENEEEKNINEDYDAEMADIYYEEKKLGLRE